MCLAGDSFPFVPQDALVFPNLISSDPCTFLHNYNGYWTILAYDKAAKNLLHFSHYPRFMHIGYRNIHELRDPFLNEYTFRVMLL